MINLSLSQRSVDVLTMLLPTILILAGMNVAVGMDFYIGKQRKRTFFGIMGAAFVLIAQNMAEGMVNLLEISAFLSTAVSVTGYCIRPVILVLFLRIVNSRKKYVWGWVLCGINAALYTTAFFSPLVFYYTENGTWAGGPLRNACLVLCMLLLIQLVAQTIRKFRHLRSSELFFPILNALLIVGSIILDYGVGSGDQIISFLTIAIVISSLFFYIWLHLQLAREHEEALRNEQRIKLMMTQIQPHFLYNTIATIQSLCHIDPDKAYEVTGKFGTYLRQNLDTIEKGELIPIKTEIEHTKIYADIEITRFPYIKIEYDIEDEDFKLPALTIQPMVENAIRHGVRSNKNGVVSILTFKDEAGHKIVIRDNGKGFDPTRAAGEEGHIGITNVTERIEKLCNGTLEIESTLNEGTAVTITIPYAPNEKIKAQEMGESA